jgi:hypothetical protein
LRLFQAKSQQDPISKNKSSMETHTSVISDMQEAEVGRLLPRTNLGQKCKTLPEKQLKAKRARGMTQVVEQV